jgi:MGT family glycosyltransferase
MPDTCKRLNVLITTWEGGGSVGPMLTLARKLQEAGHAVRVMSDACNRPETEALGLRFAPWTRAPSRTDRTRHSELIRDWAAPSPAEGFRQAIDDVFAGPAYAYAQDVIEELQGEPADLVVTNDFLLGVMAGCESIGQPLVSMACNINMFPIDDAPISGPGHDRTPSPEEAAQAAGMVAEFRAILDAGLPALNPARALLGLSPLATLLDQFSYARTTLVAVSKYFDMVREPVPPAFRYVGPQLDEAAWTQEPKALQHRDERPLVLVSFSTTFQNHTHTLQRVIDGLADLPIRVVVTLGPTIAPEELCPSGNCSLLPSARHGPLMRQASLVITHGGHGTIARAMVHRLPMLVMPHGRDQEGNALRVSAHGAGLMLSPAASMEEIREAAEQLLREPAFAAAARTLGEEVAREAKESDIVHQVERQCCPVLT